MIEITKEQLDYLIEKKYLKMEYGKYPDLVILNRHKKGKRKKRLVPYVYEKFLVGV